jgi:hypothetical protein
MIYEVSVEVDSTRQEFYSSSYGCWFTPNRPQMIHIERRTPVQARREGEKYGHVRSVRKLDVDRIRGSIEHLDIKSSNPPPPPPDIIKIESRYDPVAIDEFVWKKSQKRRESMRKEKEKIFKE